MSFVWAKQINSEFLSRKIFSNLDGATKIDFLLFSSKCSALLELRVKNVNFMHEFGIYSMSSRLCISFVSRKTAKLLKTKQKRFTFSMEAIFTAAIFTGLLMKLMKKKIVFVYTAFKQINSRSFVWVYAFCGMIFGSLCEKPDAFLWEQYKKKAR